MRICYIIVAVVRWGAYRVASFEWSGALLVRAELGDGGALGPPVADGAAGV